MKIGPANSATPLTKEKQEAAKKTNQEPENQKAKEDQLSISSRARELQEQNARISGKLTEFENNSEKKLDLIRTKIRNRFYDDLQTKLKIADKLSDDKEILREFYKSIY